MDHTELRRPRAIGCLLALFLACSPDLQRESARLELRIVGVPEEAERISARFTGPKGSHLEEVEIRSFDGSLAAESVAIGTRVSIEVRALAASTVLRGEVVSVLIEMDPTVVVVDLGQRPDPVEPTDGGLSDPRALSSGPLSLIVESLRAQEISGSVLRGSVDADRGGILRRFVDSASRVFGGAPRGFAISRVSLVLEPGAQGITSVFELWSGPLSLSLEPKDPGPSITVASIASLPMGPGPVELEVSSGREALEPLLSAFTAGDLVLAIFGPTERSPQGSFEADVRLSVDYLAYEE